MSNYSSGYFTWLVSKVDNSGNYTQLLRLLYERLFHGYFRNDSNREADGLALRRVYEHESGETIDNPYCNVLEMMVALAVRCESEISYDIEEERPEVVFHYMLYSLGLDGMTDNHYDDGFANYILNLFLDRQYSPDGKGGLFYIPGTDRDMRKLEIWYQMQEYLIAREATV